MHPTWNLALNIHETALVILSGFQGLKCPVHLLLTLILGSNFHVSITLPMNPLLNLFLREIIREEVLEFAVSRKLRMEFSIKTKQRKFHSTPNEL